MKIILISLALFQLAAAAEPLRVFIRSGEKTHRPGCHDYPAFLKGWTALLNERGAKATGGNEFPTKEQLAETDVVILHSSEAGNIMGEDRANFEAYLKRGGGVVAIHGGTVSRDPDWYKTVIGGSWNFDHTRWLEGHMSLYFTDRENPITEGASNFDLEDEIYYDMDMMPEAKILAAAYTPKPKKGEAKPGAPVSVYDIQPQIWAYETGSHRAFACIPGHVYENFSHISLQTILLRGIAWAGKIKDTDAFLKDKPGTESALRYPVGGPTRPEDAASKIEVHPEFDISLVAAEPLINKVLNLDWDEKGRMWVVESPEYPNGLRKVNTEPWKDSGSVKPGVYDRDPLDRISILTDTDGDGLMDKKQIFADKLELATSFILHESGVIVSAAPDIWFLEDTDGDEVADKRTKLYTGLGNGDTHAVMNNLRWGLDGWVYATHGYSAGNVKCLAAPDKPAVGIGSGVVRFKPDGTEIEQYASRRGNTWGLCMTTDGQCFWTQPTSGTVFFHTVLPEHVLAKGKISGTESYHGMVVSQKTFPLMEWEQAAYKQIDWVGSYTAAAGCAVYEGGAWPEEWNRSYFVGEPTINIVSHYFVKPDGITYTTEKEKGREETEFVRSKDLWFRPVETRIGPDGALYLVDFYNQAVIHNDTRGPQHGPATAAVRPDRDHYFGRIWRIQHKEAKEIQVPQIDREKPGSLSAALRSPNAHTRMTAMRLMREAGTSVEAETGSAALKAYREAREGSADELIAAFAKAEDKWTRSALVAAASGREMEVISATLAEPEAAKLTSLVENILPVVLEGDPSATAARLIVLAAKAPSAADSIKVSILGAIVADGRSRPELTEELRDCFSGFLANEATASQALPLIVRLDRKREMDSLVARQIEAISAKLADPKVPVAERIEVARNLVSIGSPLALMKPIWILTDQDEPIELKSAIIQALGSTGHAQHLVNMFNDLSPESRAVAFGEIVKNPGTSYSFLIALEEGRIKASLIGPGEAARLRSHPEKTVSELAKSALGDAMEGAAKREEIIAKFLPEVGKPGDAVNGKFLFSAACAVCHRFGDLGELEVGPGLTGMGMHAPEELLVHIVDPNREVDPSYWQWNITTKKGETLSGVITTENRASLTLRNQGGDTEIQKSDIATRVNPRRSLMPEGLDGLGAEGMRDIIAYMSATDRAVDEQIKALPADSTSETGMRFAEPKRKGGLHVLIVGAGSSHHFPRDFIVADRAALSAIPSADVIGTMNLAETLENMPKADVIVFSGNHDQWGTPEFQKALNDFADAGKGIVLLHAATWSHPWKGYNKRFVAGETKGHGKGQVAADRIGSADHPVLKGVPEFFTIEDESYHFAFFEKEGHSTLIENKPDGKSETTHPALWIVNDPKARIVAYTHGHDEKSHANPAYQTILRNAVRWVAPVDK